MIPDRTRAARELLGLYLAGGVDAILGDAAANHRGEEEPLARRFSLLTPPWGHEIAPTTIEGIATLVVTGRWNDEYEAIAAVLARHGAEHRTLAGHGHRPQDHPGFAQLVKSFIVASS